MKTLNSRVLDTQVLAQEGSSILVAVVEDNKRVVEYVLSDQETGSTHKLIGNPTDTPRERLIAHWKGFTGQAVVNVQVVQLGNKKPFLPFYNTMKELNDKIKKERAFEYISSFVFRRETEVIFMFEGERCGETNWEGTKSDLLSIIETNLKAGYNIDEIYVSGGYDSSDSRSDYTHGLYEPQCHMWDVLVWNSKCIFPTFDWVLL